MNTTDTNPIRRIPFLTFTAFLLIVAGNLLAWTALIYSVAIVFRAEEVVTLTKFTVVLPGTVLLVILTPLSIVNIFLVLIASWRKESRQRLRRITLYACVLSAPLYAIVVAALSS
jgi:uncharacterized membrane protein